MSASNTNVVPSGISLWIPTDNGTNTTVAESTANIIDVTGTAGVLLPVVCATGNRGDETRLSLFLTGRMRLLHYYNDILCSNNVSATRFVTTSVSNTPNQVTSVQRNLVAVARRSNTAGSTRDRSPHAPSPIASIGIREGLYGAWEAVVATLFTELESVAFLTTNTTKDVARTVRVTDIQASIVLLRPKPDGSTVQLCLLFGHRKWRQRRSMHLTLMRITFATTIQDDYEVSCSCVEYPFNNCCSHSNSVLQNAENKMRLASLRHRLRSCVIFAPDNVTWEWIPVPRADNDDVKVYVLFRRTMFSSIFPTTSAVMFDGRQSRMMRSLSDRVSCALCPGVSANRMLCQHEKAAINLMKALENSETENSIATNVYEALAEDASNIDVSATEEGIEHGSLNYSCDGVDFNELLTDSQGGIQKERATRMSEYASKKPRSFFPCVSDESRLISLLRMAHNAKEHPDLNAPFVGIDYTFICRRCEAEYYTHDHVLRARRTVWLHTLHHGSLRISVTDLKCPGCNSVVYYDGLDDSVFCVTKNHTLTRELLDAWVWDTCGNGGTFRDAFSSWSSKAMMCSVELHRIGELGKLNRQVANDAFAAFLCTLQFPSEQDLSRLFSCSTCEKELPSGERVMDGVVMDGTAVGILDKLPQFQRDINLILPVPRVPDRQYIMRTAKYRAFIESVLLSARHANDDGVFSVPLKTKLWKSKEELISRFFFLPSINDEALPVASFMVSAFEYCSWKQRTAQNEEGTGELIVQHKMKHTDVRRTTVIIGREYASGSIAGGVMRDVRSVASSNELITEIRRFVSCSHSGNVEGFCTNCCKAIFTAGQKSERALPCAGKFAQAIADSAMSKTDIRLRGLAASVTTLMELGVVTRTEFSHAFDANMGDDVANYWVSHRNGDNYSQASESNWLREAQRTGELFPGRPQVRPGVDFGRAKRAENVRSCRKNYTKSDSHSPGLFTVQCVCRNPKLIGVSVMQECEGVSTALSVLLSRFRKLPRVCYYDNACNLARSIAYRVPWVNDECLVVCDRFHYRSHKCSTLFDPSSYPQCANHATSAAESINHLWSFSKSHLRFLHPENLMPFIAARAVFINVRSNLRQELRKSEISVSSFIACVRQKWKCSCRRCNSQSNGQSE